jgi:hypothetical protein
MFPVKYELGVYIKEDGILQLTVAMVSIIEV